MLRLGAVAGLALVAAACATVDKGDKLRDFVEDGHYLYDRGAYGPARQTFEAALALRPNDPDLLFEIGRCYDRQGQTALAEKRYAECLGRAPGHGECRHALVVLVSREGRRDDAERLVTDWLRADSKSPSALAEDGWLWHQSGDLPRAREQLFRALQNDPRNNRALLELGSVYEEMNRPDRARVLYQRALEYRPHQSEVEFRLAKLSKDGANGPHPD